MLSTCPSITFTGVTSPRTSGASPAVPELGGVLFLSAPLLALRCLVAVPLQGKDCGSQGSHGVEQIVHQTLPGAPFTSESV